MKRLHPVFNIVKLLAALMDPIKGRRAQPPPPPEIIDGSEEWVVEEVLDSKIVRGRLRYKVKWEGFGYQDSTWEVAEDLANSAELVAEFHKKQPSAPRRIRSVAFDAFPFRSVPLMKLASRRCFSGGGMDVRGTSSPGDSPSTSDLFLSRSDLIARRHPAFTIDRLSWRCRT